MSGAVSIVTGATKGIGAGIAELLAEHGASVVVVSRSQADCEAKAAELAGRYATACYPHSCDISELRSIRALVSDTLERFGRIDVLVNNAGLASTIPALRITEEDWDRILDTNLKGVFFLSQAVARCMAERRAGRIINIASMFGMVGDKGILPYLASKGGVLQVTRGLALELAQYNIQVNAVAPGYVVTALNADMLQDPAVQEKIYAKTPMRRYGTVREIASAVLYLASPDASFITGAVYPVDGGWTAQ